MTVQGTRMFPRSHADEREEDEPEGRSEYSDEYILRSFGAHRGPNSISRKSSLSVTSTVIGWL